MLGTAALTLIALCVAVPGLQCYLFRRTYPELVSSHLEGPGSFLELLGPWIECGAAKVNVSSLDVQFPQLGSAIHLRHCQYETDLPKYQSAEIHVLALDEATHFSESMYRFLRGRVRLGGLKVPADYRSKLPLVLAASNPGGVGHNWVKARYIDPAPGGYKLIDEEGLSRVFIPAKLTDNKILTAADPLYVARLKQAGSEQLVKAWLDGNWDIIDGAYFDCWSGDMVIRPFEIPKQWLRFRSFDWGSARPFSCGWWAVAGETYQGIPKGALVRYREWYGARAANEGLKLTAEQVSAGIRDMEAKGEEIAYSVADPAIFAEDGGPSIAERMAPIYWTRADNKRTPGHKQVGGWDQMRQRMQGQDGKPMIYCFDTCADSIRTIPTLQHDTSRPEDLDTNAEDHAADEWRYACMSRPWIRVVDDGTGKPRSKWDKAFNDDEETDSWKVA